MAGYFDKLYFGSVVPLTVLGVYGIARALADAASSLGTRLTGLIVFPYISSTKDLPREILRQKVSKSRFRMILFAAIALAIATSSSDYVVQILYDQRYWDAQFVVSLLCLGSWFSIISNLNDSALMGFGKPIYQAIGNLAKFCFIVLGLPLALKLHGFAGAVVVVVLSELVRYVCIFFGARREEFGFGVQDIVATSTLLLTVCIFDLLRWTTGLPTLTEGLLNLLWH